MRIDGKAIATTILEQLTQTCIQLQKRGVVPTLAVGLVGDDPGSASYVRQKTLTAEHIGARLLLSKWNTDVPAETVAQAIRSWNEDQSIDGIIIQRPLPSHLTDPTLLNSVAPDKDVDGFVPGSAFPVPVAKAVEILLMAASSTKLPGAFASWMRKKHVVIIGRGETAGKPIAAHLSKYQSELMVIHSKTAPQESAYRMKTADVIVSCVGRERTIGAGDIKPGAILVSVGITRDANNVLHGDYEEEDIREVAGAYTPTPGGVGPVNVACLMQNLVQAAAPQE